MNLNMRRPTGARVNPLRDRNSKADLEETLEENGGWSLISIRNNKGEWNEHREFFALLDEEKIELDVAPKGEKPDWEWMIKEFEKAIKS